MYWVGQDECMSSKYEVVYLTKLKAENAHEYTHTHRQSLYSIFLMSQFLQAHLLTTACWSDAIPDECNHQSNQ